MSYLTVGQAAELIGVPPKRLTDAIYLRKGDVNRCPLIGNRRMIPRDYVPAIQKIMQRGK